MRSRSVGERAALRSATGAQCTLRQVAAEAGLESLQTSWILHVDLDQFIAAVEILRRPELRGKPVVVGGSGDPTQRRMVVATATYEAREFGVQSGMPLRAAARKCPDAVFLPSDAPAYEEASAQVMGVLRSFPVVVEVLGWDEAFLGAETAAPEDLAADVQRTVLERTQLHCSIGIGDNKHRAKLATGFAKPRGISRLTRENWREVMFHRPTTALWGIGGKMAKNLQEFGISTVADLAAADVEELTKRFGPTMGPYYRHLAHGAGGTTVSAEPWVPRSRSHETTFESDISDPVEIRAQIGKLARQLAAEAVAEQRMVTRVAVKVRWVPFFTQTKIMKLSEATQDADSIERAALVVLDRFEDDRAVRLLGVRVEFDMDAR